MSESSHDFQTRNEHSAMELQGRGMTKDRLSDAMVFCSDREVTGISMPQHVRHLATGELCRARIVLRDKQRRIARRYGRIDSLRGRGNVADDSDIFGRVTK